MTFTSFAFRPELLKSLAELGYETPTPIQAQTIPLLLAGHDVIGTAQTGTGKTAAFALPILQKLSTDMASTPGVKGPQALIITPTRELAEQIDQNIKAYTRYLKISCQSVYGGVNITPQENKLRRGVDIVVATPGRLLDHLQRKTLSLKNVKYLVLDEADRMLDMGFLPDIKRILKNVPTERQTLLFSATMPKEIEALVKSLTQQAKSVNISPRNATADTVEQLVFKVEKANKLRLLSHLLKTQSMYSVIVFSRTRHGADRIARQLGKLDVTVARIHADRSQNQRQQALDGFKQGKFQVLVATDIAARGIDVENISHVINFDTPVHAEDYVHRIGRTGRAEATGDAYTFTCPEEEKYLKAVEKLIGRSLPVADKREYEAKVQPSAEDKLAAQTKPNKQTQQTQKSAKSQPTAKAARAQKPQQGRSERPAQSTSRQAPARQPRPGDPRPPVVTQAPAHKQAVQKQTARSLPQAPAKPAPARQQAARPQASAYSSAKPASAKPAPKQSPQQPAKAPNRHQPDAYVSRSGGGGLRVVKRSKSSYPLSGEVDYIELDDERQSRSADNERQPGNIDANTWGYPRNPVYEPWKKNSGDSRGSSGDQSQDQRSGRARSQRRRP